jgi:hypothetical protein
MSRRGQSCQVAKVWYAPLGGLVLDSLLGLLRLVGCQTHGSGRPVQQALALQRSRDVIRTVLRAIYRAALISGVSQPDCTTVSFACTHADLLLARLCIL